MLTQQVSLKESIREEIGSKLGVAHVPHQFISC